ncbi:MAG: RIP metalloprotease RseP [bacterium]|nr:RIP metalloprotease RseP [bacterium]
MFLTLISTIFVLGILVLVHELGHFITAKKLNVKVDIFSIGMGPKVFGFTRGETEYRFSAIPIGGYVKMAGEDIEELLKEDPSAKKDDDPRSFYNQSKLKRSLIIVAGSLANILLGTVIFLLIFMTGVPTLTTKIGTVVENGAAAKAGIKPNDKIIAIDTKALWKWEEMTKIIQESAGKKLMLTIERDGANIELEITPELQERTKVGIIGISSAYDFVKERFDPLTAAGKALSQTWTIGTSIIKGIYLMITGKIQAEVAGPLGIIKITGEQAKQGFLNLLFFAALLGINLGTINLFPILPLDGGYLLVMLIEKIKGSPVKLKHQLIAQQIGWALLLFLLFFASYSDIIKFYLPSFKAFHFGGK